MLIDDRFGGIARLYGNAGAQQISTATVAVVGVGGVGSWVVESLARSGIGHIILMDMDDVCITNINRQIHALNSTVGKMKTDAMAERIRDIGGHVQLTVLHSFYTAATCEKLFDLKPDVVVDAIDTLRHKAHLIASCYRRKIPLVTCGGAGGKLDASRIEVADLSRTKGDKLLSLLRTQLRKEYGLPLGKEWKKKLHIPCVFSQETPTYPQCGGGVSDEKDPQFAGRLTCNVGFGSASHVTGTFGLLMAGIVLQIITQFSHHE